MKRMQTNNFNAHYIKALELPSTLEEQEHHIELTENGVYIFDLGSDVSKWDGKEGLNIYIKTKVAPTYIGNEENGSFIDQHLWRVLPYIEFTESFYSQGLGYSTLDDLYNELNGMSNGSIDFSTDFAYVSFPPEAFVQDGTLKIETFVVIVTDYVTYFIYPREV